MIAEAEGLLRQSLALVSAALSRKRVGQRRAGAAGIVPHPPWAACSGDGAVSRHREGDAGRSRCAGRPRKPARALFRHAGRRCGAEPRAGGRHVRRGAADRTARCRADAGPARAAARRGRRAGVGPVPPRKRGAPRAQPDRPVAGAGARRRRWRSRCRDAGRTRRPARAAGGLAARAASVRWVPIPPTARCRATT